MKVPGTHDFTITIVTVFEDESFTGTPWTRTGKVLSTLKRQADRELAKRPVSTQYSYEAHLVRNDYWPDGNDSEAVGYATATPDGFAWDEWTKEPRFR